MRLPLRLPLRLPCSRTCVSIPTFVPLKHVRAGGAGAEVVPALVPAATAAADDDDEVSRGVL